MLILPTSLMTIASSFAASDPGSAGMIAKPPSTAEIAAATEIAGDGFLSAMIATAAVTAPLKASPASSSSVLSLLDMSSAQKEILGSIDNPDDTFSSLSANLTRVFGILSSAKMSDFEPIFDSPFAVLSTMALVTASDMVPFVPCQPLAISLGARYGLWAFPVCVVGQTLAGVLAFQSSRKVSDAKEVQKVFQSLGKTGQARFQKFRTESLLGVGGDIDDDKASAPTSASEQERIVFLALVGLRLAPFFPFSAGNYLLGGATDVGLRPFVLATILGCMFSNAVSVLLGMGGAELFMNTVSN